jgi:ribosomal protein S18 acetylase RimI-like enzyme
MGNSGGEDMNTPRNYKDENDLHAMCDLLMAGRKANNGSYYIHPGDLKWWLYYPPLEGAFWDHIYLWDDPNQPGRLLGWLLISPDWVGIDVYIQPELRGSAQSVEMYGWAEQQAIKIARQKGKSTLHVLWISHQDDFLGAHFSQRDFKLVNGLIHLEKLLDERTFTSQLPEGFLVRSCMGEPEVTARAKAQYRAFASKAAYESYIGRFTSFMRSPVYDPGLDIVVVAPDGQIVAFCIVWIDPVNQVGLFEPVGTHPDFQKRGLGRAVMQEGFRRLQERGMSVAIVSTEEDNNPAIKLYDSVGFQVMDRLGTYEKDV